MAPAARASTSTRNRARAAAASAAAVAAASTPPHAGGQHPLVLPSDVSFWALVLAPLVLWWAAVLPAAPHHPGGFDCGHECALRLGKPTGGHALEWWDRGVLRPAGPLLPFAVLALRATALAASSLLSWSSSGDQQQDSPSRPSPSPSSPSPSPRASSRTAVALGTLTLECLLLYAGVAVGRVLAYLAHAGALKKGWLQGHVVSDHLFLAASMLACLQAEAACALSDLRRASGARRRALRQSQQQQQQQQNKGRPQQKQQGNGEGPADASAPSSPPPSPPSPLALFAREGALALVLLAAALLYALTAADMYFTARYYHVPKETLITAAAVFLLFQAPVLAWLSARRVRMPDGAAAAAAAAAATAVAVGAAAAVGAARAAAGRRRA